MDFLEVFQQKCDGWSHEYTTAKITNATLEQVAEVAKEYCEKGHSFYKHYEGVFSNGKVEEDGTVSFTAYRESPRKIAEFFSTYLTDAVVFADVSWDYHKVYVRKNGEPYDNFAARWEKEEPQGYYDEDEPEEDSELFYDCDVVLKDKKTGVEFTAGGGMCTEDEFKYFSELIMSHPDIAPAKSRGR